MVIGLGANLGDARRRVLQAFDEIEEAPSIRVLGRSRLYRTTPVGGPPQDDYVNAAVAIQTTLTPNELLASLQEIELRHGRRRSGVRDEPRTLDLDILWIPGSGTGPSRSCPSSKSPRWLENRGASAAMPSASPRSTSAACGSSIERLPRPRVATSRGPIPADRWTHSLHSARSRAVFPPTPVPLEGPRRGGGFSGVFVVYPSCLRMSILTGGAVPSSAPVASVAAGAFTLDFDLSFLLQMVFFSIIVVALKPLLFDPLMKVFEERELQTDGAKVLARKMDEQAGEMLRRYEAELEKVRTAAAEERERMRAEVTQLEQRILAEARQETATILERGRARIAAEAKTTRAELQARSVELSREIARNVLGREVV